MNGDVKRIRLTIPERDTTAMDFIKAQKSVSASMRVLIREYVKQHGYTDPTCVRVEAPEPRIRKEEKPEPVKPVQVETPRDYVDPLELLGF